MREGGQVEALVRHSSNSRSESPLIARMAFRVPEFRSRNGGNQRFPAGDAVDHESPAVMLFPFAARRLPIN